MLDESMRAPETTGTTALTAQRLAPSSEAVDALSEAYHEPEWMRTARRKAWALYQEMEFPSRKEEAWRRTAVEQYPLDDLHIVMAPRDLDDIQDLPPCWHYAIPPVEQVSGVLVHCNSARSYVTMRREDARQGVVLEDLHTALQSHGDLIRRYWMRGTTTSAGFNKFTALHGALWHGGTFVYVPSGVRVARPLQALIAYDADGGTNLHHTLVIAERGSRVTLIQDRVSQERHPEMSVEVTEIHAEAGAWVRYVNLQHWGSQRYTVSVQEARLAERANLLWVNGALGGRMTKEFLRSNLTGPEARSMMQGFAFMRDHQHLDQSTYQHHAAVNTHSDLLYRNVLRDAARTVFYGMVRVEQGADGTQGYQTNNNLMLGDARAHAIPGLEILANDVRCSHGATVARIDQEQLFYLLSRGLPRPDAERLIVQGFVRPILERVPLAYMRERLDEEMAQRFDSAVP